MSAYVVSVGGEINKNVERTYLTDFNTAWQATLDSLKNSRLDVSNQESGFLKTKWIDNTAEKNFSDSFGSTDVYLKAQYRFRVNLSKSYVGQQASVKVTVLKEQLVQKDVLESPKRLETDSVDEQTLLYRIGRLISMKMKLPSKKPCV